MDYTKFLGKKEHAVLAYLGGAHVYGKDRRMRVEGERPAPGFHRFEVSGRHACALEAAEPDLGDLPKARGHLVVRGNEAWLASSSGLARLSLLPEDEPPPLSLTRARRWHSGDLLFEALDFDGEAEEAARLRLEQVAPLGDLKGVPATLRTAFGVSLGLAVSRRLDIPVSVREIAHAATSLAEGEPAARALLERLANERRIEQERAWIQAVAAGAHVRPPRPGQAAVPTTRQNARERAETALDGTDARLLAARPLANGARLEVAFEFLGERFTSVVDAITLQVLDAGVCLAGEDSLVTLDSLPGVIREAIDTDRLVITRH